MSGHCNDCGNTICVCKVEDDIQFKSVQDLTRELQDKLASQQKIIEELKKGLEFYADENSWYLHKDKLCEVRRSIVYDDTESFGVLDERGENYLKVLGGKTARSTLKKLEEMEG